MKLKLQIVNKTNEIKSEVQAENDLTLVYSEEYVEGDKIIFESSEKDTLLFIQFDDDLHQDLIYLSVNKIQYNIPFKEKRVSYSPRTFLGKDHVLRVRIPRPEEINSYRNLALNSHDQTGQVQSSGVTSTKGFTGYFPHAYANVETRGEAVFAARNAIDGVTANKAHGEWPYQSWGINCDPNAAFTLDFGRPVDVDFIRLFTRADFPHDAWWNQVSFSFSDGSSFDWRLEKSYEPHEIRFPMKKITWLRFEKLIKADDPSPFPALTEIEVYGKDSSSSTFNLFYDEIKSALVSSVSQVQKNISKFADVSQNHSSVSNFYSPCKNDQWTCGFWPGEIWLSYEFTKDLQFKLAGEKQVKSMLYRIENKISVDHHDMGFLYSPSCVSAWKITKNEDAKKAAILAADQLVSRFHQKGNFIQAWGELNSPENYRYIIDCLLNTPLLYWASEVTGDKKYFTVARLHTETCIKNSIRSDGSTYHTFFMNPTTGEPDHGATCQGYKDDSFWARGQAWGIYGTALAYKYDRREEYLDAFRRVTKFFISKLPEDFIPYWDMIFTTGSKEPRDSSSAAIVCCGILEMCSILQQEDSKKYRSEIETLRNNAMKMLKSLIENYSVKDSLKTNGLLLHGTYSKKSPYNTCTPEGVDECTSWGDYFYLEALTRAYNPNWEMYW